MVYSFHPFPIVTATRILIAIIILALLFVIFRDFLSQFFIPLVIAIVVLGFMRIISTFALAGTYTVTLDETSVIYNYGIMQRTQYVLPYSKITETRLSQGVLDQLFGVASLTVDTAGYTDIPLCLTEIRVSDVQKTLNAINASNTTNTKK